MAAKPVYAVGLDVGSRSRLIICVLENERLRFLGAGSAASHGWAKGKIVDQNAVTESILEALREAEACAEASVESAVVGMGGPAVRGANARGGLDLGYPREIGQREVNRAMDHASRVQLQDDRMLLQMLPQDFVVDGHPGHRDPRKMVASHLEANVHLITASVKEHTALVGAVNLAHLAVEETVCEGLASCFASVLPEERREGAALVDIGAQSTGLVAYYGDALHLASTVKISGDHFTRDLAQALCLSFDDAERVKLEYGGALMESCPDNVWVELPSPDSRGPRECSRKFICQVLEARSVELFRFVHAELARVGMDHALLGGIFLTGGGARMQDLCEVAERSLQCHSRFGLPAGILDLPEELKDPEWSVASGLAMYSARLKFVAERQLETAGLLGRILR
jgi:cell division protein FtsA